MKLMHCMLKAARWTSIGATVLFFDYPSLVMAQLSPLGGPTTAHSEAETSPSPDKAIDGGTGTRRGTESIGSGSIASVSRIALGVDVSPLGVGLSVATNLSRQLNVRTNGSFFNYTNIAIKTEGFDVNAQLKLASARVSLDYYPFHAGFRLSPGVMFYNQNHGDIQLKVPSGAQFTLNHQTYYSAKGSNAVTGAGSFGFGNGSPSFTLTTGWGNAIPRRARHLSFPFEVGVAFTNTPKVNFNLTGYGCDISGLNCLNVATNAQIQSNINAQVKSYRRDIEQLKTFPIVSLGLAYSFGIRGVGLSRY